MCLKLPGRRSRTTGLNVNLGEGRVPRRRDSQGPERSGQWPGRLAGPAFCKSPPDCRTVGVWLAGVPRGPAAEASGQGKAGWPQEGLPTPTPLPRTCGASHPTGAGAAARLCQCCVTVPRTQ